MRRFLVACILSICIANTVHAESIEGDWSGVLNAGGMQLTLVVHFARAGDGWTGTMDSITQGAMGIPIDEIRVEGSHLVFRMKAIGGGYEGDISDDARVITGRWKQSGLDLPLDLTPVTDAESLMPRRPQEPKAPFPYDTEDVTYPNPRAKITIAGTLSLPRTPGPHPAVLLITGSGPQDRDETLAGHKPFLVLSDHLARAGIAVLRVDDRGVGGTTGDFENATTRDFADDALAGIEYLRTRQEVDRKRIGLAGHSEGAIVAPMVAAASQDVAFIVMMAGPGVTIDRLLMRQSELIMRAQGIPDDLIQANHSAVAEMFAIVRENDPANAAPKLKAAGDELKRTFAAADPSLSSVVSTQIDASVAMVNTPWFRTMLAIDPEETLRQVKVPVLAINGSLDLQVDAEQNLPTIERALQEGGNQDVTIRALPGLNHLFQTATTGSPSEYGTIEETMAPAALQTITDWILAKTKR